MWREVMLSGGVLIAWSAMATMRALSMDDDPGRCPVSRMGIAIDSAVIDTTRVSVEIE
jgi:hypothetical protein